MKPMVFVISFIAMLMLSCSKKGEHQTAPTTDTTVTTVDSGFADGERLAELKTDVIKEASGIVASRKYAGMFWIHNDGENPNEIYLVDAEGNLKAVCELPNAYNRDWEDIAIGGGPQHGTDYLYVGDIGDNNTFYGAYYIFRFAEPDVTLGSTTVYHTIASYDKIIFNYPDHQHNAEAMMIDPQTKDIYIVTKEDKGHIFKAAYPQSVTDTVIMEEVGTTPIATITAGDISSNGQEILLKDYVNIYYWKRKQGETVAKALEREPVKLPYLREPQGEAICWATDNNAYYTISEAMLVIKPAIYRYKRK